ncbi:MAG: hypothetical protein DRO12_03520 [Thermoprotei archaeon]|nr:MAG: hypothetical protein DRO12_03520 [Thermoprotei archaeon]
MLKDRVQKIEELIDISMLNRGYERYVEYAFVWKYLSMLLVLPKKLRSKIKILDVGGAESRLSKTLAGLGFDVTVIDIHEDDYGKARFVKENILTYEFPEGYFDVIIAISTIEHVGLPCYKQAILSHDGDIIAMTKIYRWLKLGGIALVTLPYGKPHHPPEFERVYNLQSLQERILCCRWEIIEVRFARQSDDDPHVFIDCSEEEARNYDAVVLLALRKYWKMGYV